MSIGASAAQPDRRGLWRALLRRALAQGDLLGASRAWDHLRVAGAALTREEAQAAHAARRAVGHAIRDARWRHDHDVLYGIPVGGAALPAFARTHAWSSPRLLVPLAAGLLTIALVLLWRPGTAGAPAPALLPAAPAVPTAVALGGRGRTEATPKPVAIPSAAPTIAARPTLPVQGPGGAGTAVNDGAGQILPPLPNGWDRFLFRVIDDGGRPLANVCVIYGTTDCGPTRPHTNASGLWWIDFPRSDALSRTWDFGFAMTGFDTQSVYVTYVPGAINVKEIRLVRKIDGR